MNSSKKYGAARGHNFHSCVNKETTDHYSQSRCANKNPWATIRTAMLPIRIHISLIHNTALRTAASIIFTTDRNTTHLLTVSGRSCSTGSEIVSIWK